MLQHSCPLSIQTHVLLEPVFDFIFSNSISLCFLLDSICLTTNMRFGPDLFIRLGFFCVYGNLGYMHLFVCSCFHLCFCLLCIQLGSFLRKSTWKTREYKFRRGRFELTLISMEVLYHCTSLHALLLLVLAFGEKYRIEPADVSL